LVQRSRDVFADELLEAFRTLIDAGGSLLLIEHNLDVIKTAELHHRQGRWSSRLYRKARASYEKKKLGHRKAS
jgi:hypothetical protein